MRTDLDLERAHLDVTRAALVRMLDLARHRVATGAAVAGDRYTAESLGRMLKSHAKELAEEPAGPPFFGRLTFGTDAAAGDHRGQRYYLGRRHVTDEAGEPLVIDWRAPVSRAFYRASAGDPMGVVRRRRYGWTGSELTGFEDEPLDADVLSDLVVREIERPRVGPMRDIVATIQPEQDDLVRARLDESLCIQGGPGTGKTAVGLHRAAYLLYTYRERLRRGRVLVIGPNAAFLRYISAVLPTLGEVEVDQRTLDDLLPVRGSAADSDEAAAVKHDARMAEVIGRALATRIAAPTAGLVVADGSARWRLSERIIRRLVDEVRREALPYAVGRERLRARIVALLQRQAERLEGRGAAWERQIGRSAPVRAVLDEVWPAIRADDLVASLLGDRAALAAAADGVLGAAEQEAIAWPRPRSARAARWTTADAVLVDEAAGLIAHPPGHPHVIVDEAQDLSPMQCRAIARRSRHGSLTVLGDLAQGTTAWSARAWPVQLAHLGKPAAPVLPLTSGFRVPAAVVDLANRLLQRLGVDVPETRAVRTDGSLRFRPADDPVAACVAVVRDALQHEGSIGVITADAAAPRVRTMLHAAGIPTVAAGDTGRVTVLAARAAKGLEYDHVVLVDPAAIAALGARGLNHLYVAMTRAVSRLDVVGSTRDEAPPATALTPGRG